MKTAWIKILESSLKTNEIKKKKKKKQIQVSGELSRTFESTKQVGARWDCAGPECQVGVDIRGLLVGISDLLLATPHTNSMDVTLRTPGVVEGLEAWHVAVHGVAKSQT